MYKTKLDTDYFLDGKLIKEIHECINYAGYLAIVVDGDRHTPVLISYPKSMHIKTVVYPLDELGNKIKENNNLTEGKTNE